MFSYPLFGQAHFSGSLITRSGSRLMHHKQCRILYASATALDVPQLSSFLSRRILSHDTNVAVCSIAHQEKAGQSETSWISHKRVYRSSLICICVFDLSHHPNTYRCKPHASGKVGEVAMQFNKLRCVTASSVCHNDIRVGTCCNVRGAKAAR